MRYNQFVKRLKEFGVVETKKKGKGSERYLVRPEFPESTIGPSYTIKCHGEGKPVRDGTMFACLRRLQIDPEEFFK
jgi:hypothetical protein